MLLFVVLVILLVPGIRGLVSRISLCGEDLTGSSCDVCRGVVDKDNFCLIIMALVVVKAGLRKIRS